MAPPAAGWHVDKGPPLPLSAPGAAPSSFHLLVAPWTLHAVEHLQASALIPPSAQKHFFAIRKWTEQQTEYSKPQLSHFFFLSPSRSPFPSAISVTSTFPGTPCRPCNERCRGVTGRRRWERLQCPITLAIEMPIFPMNQKTLRNTACLNHLTLPRT